MITVLIGKSASGKDTIFKELLKHSFEPIVTFTTRPKREGETNGVEYNFVNEKDFKELDLLEKREYNTAKGIWYYGMPKVDVDDKNYAVILDINGTNKLIDYYGKDKILPVYLECPLSVREKRAMQRGSFNKEEWDRRAIADEIDLDITKIKETTNSLLYCTDDNFLNNCNNSLFIEPVTTPTEIAASISYYANLIDKSIQASKKAGFVIPDSINFTQPELSKEAMDKRNHDKYVQKQLNYYKKSGKFEPAQEVEIKKGLENGVDVTKYANPDLHFNKMRLIREGLEKGIDASIYLDAGFTDGQLVEILEGAAEGLDVSTYANPKYSKELMFLAQKSLEEGVNDLPKYFDKGYDYNQIVAIYYGKKDGIDTSFYENPKLDHIQMGVIKWGVKYGVDVTKFNNPEIPADKMVEIRDNLIKEKEIKIWKKEGFDINLYVDELDCFQLEEVRLGLEKNLDVSVYAKGEYDYAQMEIIREALEENIYDIADFINYGPAYSDIGLIEKYIELSKLAEGNLSFRKILAVSVLKPTDNFDTIYDYLQDIEKELEDYDYEL